jgi:hypothetical protein
LSCAGHVMDLSGKSLADWCVCNAVRDGNFHAPRCRLH